MATTTVSDQHPRAFIVLGPESSGTRLLTQILINAGCAGSYDHVQPFDLVPPSPDVHPLVVWRRSVPHDGNWLDLLALISRLGGYSITIVIIFRDQFAVERSQVRVGHTPTIEKAQDNILRAYDQIFSSVAWSPGLDFRIVSYESLTLGGDQAQAAQSNLLESLGLPVPAVLVPTYDGNSKYRDSHGQR